MANSDRIDAIIGANLRRVILEDLKYPTVQVAHEPIQGLSLDALYKRITGSNSIRLRDISLLAEAWKVDPGWLAAELVKQSSKRDIAIAALANAMHTRIDLAEKRLDYYCYRNPNVNWEVACSRYHNAQIEF